jgi:hypothetical protein
MTCKFLTAEPILNGRKVLWGSRCGIRLVGAEKTDSKFGVEFGSDEEAEGDDVEPEEKSDSDSKRAVDLGVVREPSDIPAEGNGRDEPQERRDDGSGEALLPWLPHGAAQVVDDASETDAAG